jgi:hypothetical protein
MENWAESRRIFIVQFRKSDIVCIPTYADGKFRVKRCKVVGEKNLIKLGLVKARVAKTKRKD